MYPLIGEARIAERQALYERAGQKISHDQALGEVVNDMLGNRIVEPSFWSYVAKKNLGVFQRLATVVKATLARITDGGADYGTTNSSKPFWLTLKQAKDANGHIDRALSKYLDDTTAAKVNVEAEHMAKQTAEEKKPKPEESTGRKNLATELRTHEVPLHMIKLSEDVPQFKEGSNAQGVVEPLGGKFDRRGVAPIHLWKRMNGDLEVISGRTSH
ncbi:MAG: hypothetical protein H7255_12270 [Ramlibacter sp.]|nr:hypothetical protein [Ramlibacter sp.]